MYTTNYLIYLTQGTPIVHAKDQSSTQCTNKAFYLNMPGSCQMNAVFNKHWTEDNDKAKLEITSHDGKN